MPRARKLTTFNDDGQVQVPISEAAQREKALELAAICAEIDKLKADNAEKASSGRKALRTLTQRQRVLAECVRTGTEMRDAQEHLDLDSANGRRKPRVVNGDHA
jgi:hypothetical protein